MLRGKWGTEAKLMAGQTEQKVVTPPYVTYRTFINSLIKLKERGVPARIDSSVFSGQSNSGIAALLAAYKYLGLMKDNAAPSDTLHQLVAADDTNRGALIKALLESRYSFLQSPQLDLANATTQQVESAFREQGIKGSTITKAVSFFLAAAGDAGIGVSGHIKTPAAKRSGPARTKRNGRGSGKGSGGSESGNTGAGTGAPPPAAKTAAEQLLGKFPDFDPTWPEEIKTKWFESFASLRGAMLKEEPK
ncbi:hypothetical protein [Pseudoxanthomonas sacheonensis]|uniref:Uncharacterized protein n=1 Tax=Pseudoxanthomonas sacheonensis TaxID=443615 RepID=A0ABU1RVN6_9GAMM|nr:hypothetical protein [Pseudoxanthomonas sacheonensis]MDR6842830.1 hypothetical protein [Pseudoxanthomonas sacheonensis]